MKKKIYQAQLKQGRIIEGGDFPKVVLIDSVSFCNLSCVMCGHKAMKRKKGIMPWGLFKKIINEIAKEDKNIRVWMVFFGEALLLQRRKPSIFDMIGYAKNKGLTDVVLNSNGNLLDEEAAISLINSGLDSIYIGIDAFSSEVYSQIRIGGNYEKLIKNTMHLIKIKKKMKSEKPKIYAQFVKMGINLHQKDDFINFWKAHGITVKIRPKVSWAGLINAPNQNMGNKDRWPCYWAMRTMSITDAGKVVTCAVDVDASFVAGDANRQSLKEIWNNSLKELREMHIAGRFEELPDLCRHCKDWQSARADYF